MQLVIYNGMTRDSYEWHESPFHLLEDGKAHDFTDLIRHK
jgi:hypothetical protein